MATVITILPNGKVDVRVDGEPVCLPCDPQPQEPTSDLGRTLQALLAEQRLTNALLTTIASRVEGIYRHVRTPKSAIVRYGVPTKE